MKFEIAYRKNLLKRLEVPLRTLKRQRVKEIEEEAKELEKLSGYENIEEAQNAYGYGEITAQEYEKVLNLFEKGETGSNLTVIGASLEELQDFISRLKKDISYFEWEMLSDEEKERLTRESDEFKERIKRNKEGLK